DLRNIPQLNLNSVLTCLTSEAGRLILYREPVFLEFFPEGHQNFTQMIFSRAGLQVHAPEGVACQVFPSTSSASPVSVRKRARWRFCANFARTIFSISCTFTVSQSARSGSFLPSCFASRDPNSLKSARSSCLAQF